MTEETVKVSSKSVAGGLDTAERQGVSLPALNEGGGWAANAAMVGYVESTDPPNANSNQMRDYDTIYRLAPEDLNFTQAFCKDSWDYPIVGTDKSEWSNNNLQIEASQTQNLRITPFNANPPIISVQNNVYSDICGAAFNAYPMQDGMAVLKLVRQSAQPAYSFPAPPNTTNYQNQVGAVSVYGQGGQGGALAEVDWTPSFPQVEQGQVALEGADKRILQTGSTSQAINDRDSWGLSSPWQRIQGRNNDIALHDQKNTRLQKFGDSNPAPNYGPTPNAFSDKTTLPGVHRLGVTVNKPTPIVIPGVGYYYN